MTAKKLLAKLTECGVELSVVDGDLRCRSAGVEIPSHLKQEMRKKTGELVALLQDAPHPDTAAALGDEADAQLRAFWAAAIPADVVAIDLPFDRPRPEVRSAHRAEVDLDWTADFVEAIAVRADEADCSPFVFVLAAFKALVYRYTGRDDIVVGAGKLPGSRASGRDAPDWAATLLPIRSIFADHLTFRDILRNERDAWCAARDHRGLSFDEIVEAIAENSEGAHQALAQFVVAQVPNPGVADSIQVSAAPGLPVPGQADLAVHFAPSETGLAGAVNYDAALFDRSTVERLLANLETLIESAVEDPDLPVSRLSVVSENERRHVLYGMNQTFHDYPRSVTLVSMFEDQVARSPDAVALVCEDAVLTYREFDERANQLARYLIQCRVGPNTPVGLYLERSVEMLVGIYGILKAGGAYMPLDPDYPSERIAFMLEESNPAVVLTQERFISQLPAASPAAVCLDRDWSEIAQQPAQPVPLRAAPSDLAYVIYTSGSTGRPKGVMVDHSAICNREFWVLDEYGFRTDDVVIQKFPFGFDASVCELFTPLLCGARLVIARPGGHRDSAYLAQQIARHGVTTIQIVPSMLELLLDDATIAQCGSLRRVLCGGEALTHALHKRLTSRLPDCQLHNMYGPTEAAINVTAWDCRDSVEHRTIPIGHPVANTQIYVLDPFLEPVPIGVSGELYIGGAQLARGYLNRPDLTEERFIPSPFTGDGSGRPALLYKTGDLCRRLEDGSIEYVDRIDYQVKVRGLRIELGEIEAAIVQLMPDPLPVVVSTWTPAPSDVRLVAYIETKRAGALDLDVLREKLRRRLPEYMVPPYFVELDEFPITVNGKTDRQKLPAPTESVVDREIVPAENETEERLFVIWGEVLGTNDVSRTDNFFDCGGHSLLAMKLIGRIEREFGVRIKFRILLNAALSDVALHLAEGRAQQVDSQAVTRVERGEGGVDLALAQEPFWLLHMMNPDDAIEHVWLGWIMEGELNRDAVQGAFDALIRRHESLRLRVDQRDGKGFIQAVDGCTATVEFQSLRDVAPEKRELEQQRVLQEAIGRPLDFSNPPLFRLKLVELEPDKHILLWVIHHIVVDGVSVGLLQTEFVEHYNALQATGAPAPLPELRVQYMDFAAWQRSRLVAERVEELKNFWKSALPSDLAPLALPTDFPRPATQTFNYNSSVLELSADLTHGLRARAKEEGCTLFVALMACLKVLFHRISGQDDVIIGVPVALRDDPDLADMVGMLLSTLPIRSSLAGDETFRATLSQEQSNFLEVLDHKDLPFHQIAWTVQPTRDPSRNPIFQVMLEMLPDAEVDIPGLEVSQILPEGGGAPFDMAFYLWDAPEGVNGFVRYNRDLFKAETVARLLEQFKLVIDAMVRDPDVHISKISLLSDAEQKRILHDWNATTVDYPEDSGVHQLIDAQVERSPDAPALVFDGVELSYGELDRRANQLANHLRELGVGPDVMVGLNVERSAELVVGALAILKAGGAYIPMDPAYPKQRLAYMLEDTHAPVIVTQAHLVDELPPSAADVVCLDDEWSTIAQLSDRPPPGDDFRSDQLAYVIFTSGSTGRPKGVMVEHRNVANFFTAMDGALYPGMSPADICRSPGTWLAVTSLSFDISVLELFWTLSRGYKVVVHDDRLDQQGAEDQSIPALAAAHGVTHMQCVPAMARMLLSDAAGRTALARLQKLLIGGEAFPGPLATDLNAHVTGDVVNMYGPTETTVWSTTYPAQGDGATVPIGRPVANTQVYVVDQNNEPLPFGVPGELFIGGAGVTRGYVGRPDLTAERFVDNPFDASGSRLYRTGDRVAYRPDGVLEYLGRLDFQVKIRGFRIELGEIEEAIAQCLPEPVPVVVSAWNPVASDVRLVAYIETEALGDGELEDLRDKLRRRLPDYMVPQHFVELAVFPKTSNGKIDRKCMPAPEIEGSATSLMPETAVEREMARLWQRRLGVQNAGRQDRFFDLGGHSLSAVQLAADIGRTFGVPFSLRDLMQEPRLDALSLVVEQRMAEAGERSHVADPVAVANAGVAKATPHDLFVAGAETRIETAPPRKEGWWQGLKNRVCQILAFYAPGQTSLRVKLHRARGVTLGKRVSIGIGALIETSSPHLVVIGDKVQIGIRTTFIAHFGDTASKTEPTIRIEDDVFIGPGAIILPNVTLGRGSVVTAGSVVNASVPPKTVVQGNPAMPVARCHVPLAWNSYASYAQGLEPLEGDIDADQDGAE